MREGGQERHEKGRNEQGGRGGGGKWGGTVISWERCDVRLMCRWPGMSFPLGVVDCRPSYRIGSGILSVSGNRCVSWVSTDRLMLCLLTGPDPYSVAYERYSNRDGNTGL